MPVLCVTLIWLIPGAVQDWRCREVSSGLVFLGLVLGLLVRWTGHAEGTWIEVTAMGVFMAIGWQLQWVGGADVKAILAIALASVPLAAWAWAGVVLFAAVVRVFLPKDRRHPFPGFVGFAAGIAANLIFLLIGG
ncbi:MAG: prepilin peptidase [Anaerolineales bacterium]|nr:prepilin peptidase [Anaerolineales bacterium]